MAPQAGFEPATIGLEGSGMAFSVPSLSVGRLTSGLTVTRNSHHVLLFRTTDDATMLSVALA